MGEALLYPVIYKTTVLASITESVMHCIHSVWPGLHWRHGPFLVHPGGKCAENVVGHWDIELHQDPVRTNTESPLVAKLNDLMALRILLLDF